MASDESTKEELYEQAQEADVEGRSSMTKEELKEALQDAPVAPKTAKKGVYVLEQGDTPGSVSVKLFGRGHRAVDLARANPDVNWDVGDEITIP